MASDGQPVSSQWGYVDGKTYLLDMYGIMQTGWQMVNGKWYYLNSVGAMQTGWLLKEGKYYFLNADGSMAAAGSIPRGSGIILTRRLASCRPIHMWMTAVM